MKLQIGHHYQTRGGKVFTVVARDKECIGSASEFICSDQHSRGANGIWCSVGTESEHDAICEVLLVPVDNSKKLNEQGHAYALSTVLDTIVTGIPDNNLRDIARAAVAQYRTNHTNEHP